MGYRQRLGLDESTPLIGIFGFLKPYKRISESLRAFRRLHRIEPRAKMILVGETHLDLSLAPMISALGLSAAVRVLGFTAEEDFIGYLGACDIILNLRYPTVGETSGTLLRSLGLGRAVIVSDVGAFGEFPEDTCLRVPVGPAEEDLLFEYMNLLVARKDLAAAMGRRARRWVERECSWPCVARRYASFLQAVAEGREWREPETEATVEAAPPEAVPSDYILGWAGRSAEGRDYAETHLARLQKTLEITPPGAPHQRALEMGAYLQITPALKTRLGYGEVRGCYYGPAGRIDHRRVTSLDGEEFLCEVDLFDAGRDPFPYPDGHFATVLCCELIEHLPADPMHLMTEINRILAAGGHLVLTTPNLGSLRALSAVLQGYHPGFFPAYLRPRADGEESDARHSREYTPREIQRLLADSGFTVVRLETGPFREEARPEHAWVTHLLERYGLTADLRGDGIYAVGRKTGPVRQRYPAWLYS